MKTLPKNKPNYSKTFKNRLTFWMTLQELDPYTRPFYFYDGVSAYGKTFCIFANHLDKNLYAVFTKGVKKHEVYEFTDEDKQKLKALKNKYTLTFK